MTPKEQPAPKTPEQKIMEANIWKLLKLTVTILALSLVWWLSLWGVLSYFSLPIPNPLQVMAATLIVALLRSEIDGLRKWWRGR